MAKETGISWTDSTFNAWWGCDAVSPACDNCYAAALDRRTGGKYWESNVRPRRTSETNWEQPVKWNKRAEAAGDRHKVFSGSMMDVLDNRAPDGARDDLWSLIRRTPMLDWQLLTKRATLIEKFLPADWGVGYSHVWLGCTVEDVRHGKPRIDVLRTVPARIRFLSIEPLLEDLGSLDLSGIDWIIVGGESGAGARPMHGDWARRVINQARDQRVAVWFKQWGGTTAYKGGCVFDGQEIKEFPLSAGIIPHDHPGPL